MTDNLKIGLDDEDTAERADYLVCMKATFKSPFTDNAKGHCCICGCQVIFRQSAPKRPKRVCVDCVSRTLNHE